MVVLVGLAIDQIAQSGLSSLSVIYYSAHLFSEMKAVLAAARMSIGSNDSALSDVPHANSVVFVD
ncbi:hypothetical protein C3369_22770 [Escherichia sp. ESNIH1]|nr:hypothetical protein C3369_22770 [Escherichia sp. ESNIH1]